MLTTKDAAAFENATEVTIRRRIKAGIIPSEAGYSRREGYRIPAGRWVEKLRNDGKLERARALEVFLTNRGLTA